MQVGDAEVTKLVILEFLYYLMNKYGKMIEKIKSLPLAFFDGLEILATKELIFKHAKELNIDKLTLWVDR